MKKCVALLLIALCILQPVVAETKAPAPLEVITMLQNKEHEALYAFFSDELKSQVPLENLASLWDQILALGKTFIEAREGTAQKSGDNTMVVLYLDMENQDLYFTLVYSQSNQISGLGVSPVPEKVEVPQKEMPQGIQEIAVTIGEGSPWELPGIITLPDAAGDETLFPGVVLVHGSGPNDKNETMGALTPFQDIAWALAQQGIASIRYDKRTLVHGPKLIETFGSKLTVKEETIEDAVIAAKILLHHEQVDESKLYVAGHSLGAMLTPRIVAAGQEEGVDFAGMVLLCGSPLSLVDISVYQNEFLVEQTGGQLTDEQKKTALEPVYQEKEKFEALKTQGKEGIVDETILTMPAYYLVEMAEYDPAQIIKSLQLPTLILQGGEDFQVPPKMGIDLWEKALGDLDYVACQNYPTLNHGLVTYTGDKALQYTTTEYNTPGDVDEQLLKDLVQFFIQ